MATKPRRSPKPILIPLVVAVLVIFGIGGFFAYRALKGHSNSNAENRNVAGLPMVTIPSLTSTGTAVRYTDTALAGMEWTIDQDTLTRIAYQIFASDGTNVTAQARAHRLASEDLVRERPVDVGLQQGWQITTTVDFIVLHSYTIVGKYLVDVSLQNPVLARHFAQYEAVLQEVRFSGGGTANASLNIPAGSAANRDPNAPDGSWKTYTNSAHRFSFRYPSVVAVTPRTAKDPVDLVLRVGNKTTPDHLLVYGSSGTMTADPVPSIPFTGNDEQFDAVAGGSLGKAILATLAFLDDPAYVPATITTTDTSSWQTYSSKQDNLQFKHPAAVDVSEQNGTVFVALGKVQTFDTGTSNAFMTIASGADGYTRDTTSLENPKTTTVTIGGRLAKRTIGMDYGRYEGDSAGTVVDVLVANFSMHIEERPANTTQSEDVLKLADQVLGTLTFTQ